MKIACVKIIAASGGDGMEADAKRLFGGRE